VADDLLRVVVRLPGGPVTLLPKRAPIGNSALLRGRALAVLAAGGSQIQAATRLPDHAESFDATFLPGQTPGTAILDIAEADAVNLGRALALPEILYWDGRRGRMVGCR
jgi:hypothetical protein